VNNPVRRVVTGHDAGGVAKVLFDNAITEVKRGKSGMLTNLWNTKSTPADIAIGENIDDPGKEPHITAPPANGSRFVIIDYPPGNSGTMDDSSVHLKTGDVMVQRGTNHAWFNRGTENARVAFVLIDAEPLGIGHPRLHE
jgi:hypothetical protein